MVMRKVLLYWYKKQTLNSTLAQSSVGSTMPCLPFELYTQSEIKTEQGKSVKNEIRMTVSYF